MTSTRLLSAALVAAAATFGCGGHGGGGAPPPPAITSINNSTTPTAKPGTAIEITGTGFGGAPGQVLYTQGTLTGDITPSLAASWSDGSILAVLPASGVAVPGTLSVTVVTAGGTSNARDVGLVDAPAFSPASVQWAATTSLPAPRRAHAAAAVRAGPAGTALVLVLGGNDGAQDLSSVLQATLQGDGQVGAWTAAPALPAARAFLGAAVADENNAPVGAASAFVYAVGGQAAAGDTPGGTATVFVAAVDRAGGTVGAWTATASLPETRVGCRATVANGVLHVTGGLDANGNALGAVVSAPIQADGTLGAFASASPASDLPVPVAFHDAFAFGGFLYVVGGDVGPQTAPFGAAAALATRDVRYAQVRQGVVQGWVTNPAQAIKLREKHALFQAFGQVMVYEGTYQGGATSTEAERSFVRADGALDSFNGQTGGSIPGLNVFNGAGVTSPLLSPGGTPRFLLIGGDSVTTPGTLSAAVLRTTAP